MSRSTLAKHPWSLGGGGASEIKRLIEERCTHRLDSIIDDIGFSVIIGEDEIFLVDHRSDRGHDLPLIPIIVGEEIRDWNVTPTSDLILPMNEKFEVVQEQRAIRRLWPFKTVLANRVVSGSITMKASGRWWFDVWRLARTKHRTPFSITFAFVAGHNHFVLDRGGKVFNRSAPIIKLPAAASEDDHLALLAWLNSSAVCFWMKTVCYPKATTEQGRKPRPRRSVDESL